MTPDEQLQLEVSKFYADPLGFVMFAFPWISDPELHLVRLVEPWKSRYGCEWGPEAWACELFDYVGEQVRLHGFDGLKAVPAIRCAVVSGHGITKSATTAQLIDWIMSTRPNCKGTVTAATLPQLEAKTWAELAKWTKRCITGHWFDIKTGRNSMAMVKIGAEESWRCDAQTCREENSESFAGQHAASSTSFYIFDESSGVPDVVYDVADPGGLTDGEPMLFAFGNPTINTGWFRECFRNRRHRYKTWEIDSRQVQITNKVELQQYIDDYGLDSDRVRVRVLGQFPRSSSKQFIGDDLVSAAMQREAISYLGDPLVIGVDTARFGDDETVIQIRKGRDGRYEPSRMSRATTIQIAARVQELYNEYRADGVFVDAGGPNGGGTIDQLRMLKVPVIEVHFGGKPDYGHVNQDGAVYANKRAEMYGRLKEWLKGGAIRNDSRLQVELTAGEYDYVIRDGRDAILLEPKEAIKEKIGHSPDEADALALTFAFTVQPGSYSGGRHRKPATDYDPFAEAFAGTVQ